jgi:hypothetical protein
MPGENAAFDRTDLPGSNRTTTADLLVRAALWTTSLPATVAGEWLNTLCIARRVRTNKPTGHSREGRCPQRPIYFPRDARTKHKARSLSRPSRRVRANRSNTDLAEKIRDVGDNVPPGKMWA